MAPHPMAVKRRAAEEAGRPQRKVKKFFKKQKNYHSSDDESDLDLERAMKIASDLPKPSKDAPKVHPKFSMKANKSGEKAKPTPKTIPKSILKQSNPFAGPPANVANEGDEEEDDEDDDEAEVDELERNTALNTMPNDDDDSEDEAEDNEPDLDATSDPSDAEDDEDGDGDIPSESETSMTSSQPSSAAANKKKRNDPPAFATSFQKLLDTKLTTSKRSDPVLSRSKSALEANKTIADQKLEQKARAQIRAEKKQASEKGRVKDVLGLETPDVDTGAVMEEEKRLKKTAQRGVVRLFNAVRAAQVKAEEARKEARNEGVVGMQKREEKVNEMSKQGFLDLISSGGKAGAAA